MLFYQLLFNPIAWFLEQADEGINLDDIIVFVVIMTAIPWVVFTVLIWVGGLGFMGALIAGLVIWLLWISGSGLPVFGSAVLAAVLTISADFTLPLLANIGLESPVSAIDTWQAALSMSEVTLAFVCIYLFVTWPVASLRKAIIGK